MRHPHLVPPNVVGHAPPPPLRRVRRRGDRRCRHLRRRHDHLGECAPVTEGRHRRRCGYRQSPDRRSGARPGASGEHGQDHDRADRHRTAVPGRAGDRQRRRRERRDDAYRSARRQAVADRTDDGLDDDGLRQRRGLRARRDVGRQSRRLRGADGSDGQTPRPARQHVERSRRDSTTKRRSRAVPS